MRRPLRAIVPLLLFALLVVASASAQQADEQPTANETEQQQQQQEHPEWPAGRYNPFDRSPIRVHLDLSNVTGGAPDYASEVHAALTYWETGGNGALQWDVEFELVDDPAEAEIVFWLADSTRASDTCGGSEHALGCARPFERPVPVEVLLRDDAGDWLAYRLVREVSQHELGHALGLAHSEDPNDIMAAHARLRAHLDTRPGDLARLAAGVGVLGLILAGGAYVLWRAMYTDPRMGAVYPLAPSEVDGACDKAPEGAHAFDNVVMPVRGREEDWAVCRYCQRGLPVLGAPPAPTPREPGLP